MDSPTSPAKTPSTPKILGIGLLSGLLGVAIGFFPILVLHYQIWEWVKHASLPKSLFYVLFGLPLPWIFFPVLLIGGIVFGCIGVWIGRLRGARRLWLWGMAAGALFNLFITLSAQ